MLGDNRKRIILIDDHSIVRQGLERLLNAGDEFVVCEEAGNAAEGMELVRELRPDAAIVDLILSAHDEPKYARRAAEAGAMGYVLKNDAVDTLRMALRSAFKGKRTFRDENGSF